MAVSARFLWKSKGLDLTSQVGSRSFTGSNKIGAPIRRTHRSLAAYVPLRNSRAGPFSFSQRLHAYLHRICEIIYNALVQQRAGSHLVKQALAYIREHYSEDLSLEVLAENLLVSPSYLSSLFRQNIGKTYIEYLNSYRISRAKELMQEEPYLKNYEIAVRLGYSPKYFAQIFKQLEGVTLSDYRQNLLP